MSTQQGPLDPVVIGRSPDGFEAATEALVAKWEAQRGAPERPITLRVELYVEVHGAIHDYIAVTRG